MNPAARRVLVTVAAIVAALSIFAAVVLNRPSSAQRVEADVREAEAEAAGKPPPSETTPAAPAAAPAATPEADGKPTETATPSTPPTAPQASAAPTQAAALRAIAPTGGFTADAAPTPIGSFDPAEAPFRIEFSRTGAGIQSIVFADFWQHARDRNQAIRHRRDPSLPLPPDSERYLLTTAAPLFEGDRTFTVPVLGAHSVEVDGQRVSLFGNVWSEAGPGRFVTDVVDAEGTPRLRIERGFDALSPNFDFALRQSVKNLGSTPVEIRWIQYGPSDLAADPTSYIDVRRFHFGYLLSPAREPDQSLVLANGQMFERSTVVKQIGKGNVTLWPNAEAASGEFGMVWFGTTSRYFSLAVHTPWKEGESKRIGSTIGEVRVRTNNGAAPNDLVLAELHSGPRIVAPGESVSFDLAVYAGPLDRKVLDVEQPYVALGMGQLIVYMLSSCCSWCTFAWLANLMAAFLGFLHDYVVFDWGIAIIVLVIVVRTLLHPLMKRSQIQMQRFGKAMSELKPELDALQKRYKDEPTKLQQEQLRLYREKGVNPVGCAGGMLPTFLQMPIWIALYAVLFFAFDLRQQPAFFGVFQLLGGWQFLGDLSLPDNFFVFSQPIDLWLFKLRGIYLLPLLMGIVFWIQQKYMTPPQANLTPEQEQQQKIMKIMMVVMFPLFMYPAPSGLTLYILTSTCIGILESRMVKRHIEKHGFTDPKKADGTKKQDRIGKLYSDMLARAQARQAENAKRSFKERDRR